MEQRKNKPHAVCALNIAENRRDDRCGVLENQEIEWKQLVEDHEI